MLHLARPAPDDLPHAHRHGINQVRAPGRHYVIHDDVIRVAPPVLRHRLVLHPEAELDRLTPDAVVANAIASVPVPR